MQCIFNPPDLCKCESFVNIHSLILKYLANIGKKKKEREKYEERDDLKWWDEWSVELN